MSRDDRENHTQSGCRGSFIGCGVPLCLDRLHRLEESTRRPKGLDRRVLDSMLK